MKKLYLISFAKTKKDKPRTGSLFFTKFTCVDEEYDWELVEEKSCSRLTRDEQIAHTDTLLSILCIPGTQDDDVGIRWDSEISRPLTPRVAVGVTEDVKELHTLVLTPNTEITNASRDSLDQRRFIQKDFIVVVGRLFTDSRKFDTAEDIFQVQERMAKETQQQLNKELKSSIKSTLHKLQINEQEVE